MSVFHSLLYVAFLVSVTHAACSRYGPRLIPGKPDKFALGNYEMTCPEGLLFSDETCACSIHEATLQKPKPQPETVRTITAFNTDDQVQLPVGNSIKSTNPMDYIPAREVNYLNGKGQLGVQMLAKILNTVPVEIAQNELQSNFALPRYPDLFPQTTTKTVSRGLSDFAIQQYSDLIASVDTAAIRYIQDLYKYNKPETKSKDTNSKFAIPQYPRLIAALQRPTTTASPTTIPPTTVEPTTPTNAPTTTTQPTVSTSTMPTIPTTTETMLDTSTTRLTTNPSVLNNVENAAQEQYGSPETSTDKISTIQAGSNVVSIAGKVQLSSSNVVNTQGISTDPTNALTSSLETERPNLSTISKLQLTTAPTVRDTTAQVGQTIATPSATSPLSNGFGQPTLDQTTMANMLPQSTTPRTDPIPSNIPRTTVTPRSDQIIVSTVPNKQSISSNLFTSIPDQPLSGPIIQLTETTNDRNQMRNESSASLPTTTPRDNKQALFSGSTFQLFTTLKISQRPNPPITAVSPPTTTPKLDVRTTMSSMELATNRSISWTNLLDRMRPLMRGLFNTTTQSMPIRSVVDNTRPVIMNPNRPNPSQTNRWVASETTIMPPTLNVRPPLNNRNSFYIPIYNNSSTNLVNARPAITNTNRFYVPEKYPMTTASSISFNYPRTTVSPKRYNFYPTKASYNTRNYYLTTENPVNSVRRYLQNLQKQSGGVTIPVTNTNLNKRPITRIGQSTGNNVSPNRQAFYNQRANPARLPYYTQRQRQMARQQNLDFNSVMAWFLAT